MDMNTPSNNFDLQTRFERRASELDYQRVNGSETISISELPLFVRIGKNALNTLAIVDPAEYLTKAERMDDHVCIKEDVTSLIIDPRTYSLRQRTGFKGLHDNESVRLGRGIDQDAQRFELHSQDISRSHVRISKSPNGMSITIQDLGSRNGTYIGRIPVKIPSHAEGDTVDWVDTQTMKVEREPLTTESSGFSVASDYHPDKNEDRFYVDTKNNTFAVFDGIGGGPDGDVAAEAARNYVSQTAGDATTFKDLSAAEQYLRQVLAGANKNIIGRTPEGGTTAVVAKIHKRDDELYVSVAHVGDSRAYLLRNGFLTSLTTDHTPFRNKHNTYDAAVQQQWLSDTDSMDILSEEDIHAFSQRNILGSAMGRDEIFRSDVKHLSVTRGDVIVLTTDGVHDNLTTQEMQDVLASTNGADCARALTRLASERSQLSRSVNVRAKKDDITAVAFTI